MKQDGAIHRVLIVRGAFYQEMYEDAWNGALRELGISSEIFETHIRTLPGIFGQVERRINWGPGIRRIQKDLIHKVKKERPDITLFYQGHYFDRKTLEQIRAHTFIAGYHNDDPFGERKNLLRYRLMLPALAQYHGFHVYRECNVPEAMAYGVRNVKVLKSYYLPWLDYPRKLNKEELERWGCDLVFAGHVENDLRLECLKRAVLDGTRLRLFGEEFYWRKALPPYIFDQIKPICKVTGDDYRKALSGAKIAACFFSKWNRDQYTRRVFEIPACGVFLLSERTPVMLDMFEEGKEAEYFSSPEEFMDKLRFYLRNDDKRRRIAETGYRCVTTAGHDIFSRMREWLDDVSEWKNGLADNYNN